MRRTGRSGRTIETWNLGAERVKGYTAEEAIGRSFAMFYTEDDRRRVTGDCRPSPVSGRPSSVETGLALSPQSDS